MLRGCSISTFGRKLKRVGRDTTGDGHEVLCQHCIQRKLGIFGLMIYYVFFFLHVVVNFNFLK